MSDDIPGDLRYTKEHEWARLEGDLVVIGITAHAVEQLGDITLVTLPDVGSAMASGEEFGDIDSVKAVSQLYAPLDGEVVEINEELEGAPESVNDEPYGKGWMLKVRPKSAADLDGLMDAAAYGKYVADL